MPFVEMEAGAVKMGYIGQVNEPLLEEDLRLHRKTGVQTLQGWGFQADGQLLKGETIYEITRYAREQHADLIVVGH